MAGRLVLWNIDNTLVDTDKVTRDAYTQAFHSVTGRPPQHVAPTAGRTDAEVIFETLALNDVEPHDNHLPEFSEALVAALQARAERLAEDGRALAGAERALVALHRTSGFVQSVLTGNVRAGAVAKLSAFGFDEYMDLEVGGYGSENFPRGTLVQVCRSRAADRYEDGFDESSAVVVGDSVKDVAAAHIAGVSALGVCTGRNTDAELRAEGADEVLADLSDTSAVVEAVRRLTSASRG